MGHMQGRGKGLSAPREVGDSPAEGDEGQGGLSFRFLDDAEARRRLWNAHQPPQCLRGAIPQHCGLYPLWDEAHEKNYRRLAHIKTHKCRTVATRQLGTAMPRQDCRYQDRFDSG